MKKSLIICLTILFAIVIHLKYDPNMGISNGGNTTIKVRKVKFDNNGVLFCKKNNKCGKNDVAWDGFIPNEAYYLIETEPSKKKFDKSDSVY